MGKLVPREEFQGPHRVEHDNNLDTTKLYLKEIGKTALLTAIEEVELAKRIEAGQFAGKLLELADVERPSEERAELRQELISDYIEGETKRGNEPAADEISYFARRIDNYTGTPEARRALREVARDGEQALEHLLSANLRLVVSLAKRYRNKGLTLQDVIQEGNLGLIRAAEKFDYTKGFKFSTYATWWIRQSITRGIADQARTIRLPVHMVEQVNKIARVHQDLYAKLGREPSAAEIAADMGYDPDKGAQKVTDIRQNAKEAISLNMRIGDDDESEFGDFIDAATEPEAFEALAAQDLVKDMNRVLATLDEREAMVMRMRYGLDDPTGEGKTLDEIAQHFHMSRERIRQIERETKVKMRTGVRGERLRPYLEN